MKYLLAVILLLFLSTKLIAQDLGQQFIPFKSITFHDSLNQEVDFPLSSGYSSLYAQIIDLNENGLQEIILLNKNFKTVFIAEQNEANSLDFVLIEKELKNIKIERWFYFIDYDFDSDFDVLTLDEFDAIGVLENSGTNEAMNFEAFKRIRDKDDKLIITEFGNLPVLFDINQDTKLDLFLTTQTDGFIIYYENTGQSSSRFEKKSEKYANVRVVAAAKRRAKKHGQSTFTFVDFDRDNDYDILWGDQFQTDFYYLKNSGTLTEPVYASLDEHFPPNKQLQTSKTFNIPLVADFNSDGFDDLLILPRADNFKTLQLYLGTVNFNQFLLHSTQLFSTLDAGFTSSLAIYDLNNDGKKDILLSTFLNEKSTFGLQFYQQSENNNYFFSQKYSDLNFPWKNSNLGVYDVQVIDFNQDGNWDIVYLDENAELRYAENAGSNVNPNFPTETSLFNKSGSEAIGNKGQFLITDINNDSKFDLLTSNKNGVVKLFSSEQGNFDQTISLDLLGNEFAERVLIAELASKKILFYSRPKALELNFTSNFTFSKQALELDFDAVDGLNSLRIEDLNDDGKKELLFGHENGGLLIFEENGSKKTPSGNFPIFPNPTKAWQKYSHPDNDNILEYRIVNLLGKRLKIEFKLSGKELSWRFSEKHAAGIYFLQVNSKSYKLIKLN